MAMNKVKEIMNETITIQTPIFNLNNITQLVEAILLSNNKTYSNNVELDHLKNLIQSSDQLISCDACHGIQFLVEEGFLPVIPTISMLMSILPNTKHISGIVSTLSNILLIDMFMRLENSSEYKCPFDLYKHQHPYVTILQQNSEYWPYILLEIESLYSNTDERIHQNAIEIMTPPLLLLLCSPNLKDFNGKLKTWEFIISLLPLPSAKILLLKAFHWLQIHQEKYMERNNLILLQLQSHLNKNNFDNEIISGFAPIYAAQALRLVKLGKDPKRFFTILIELHDKLDHMSSQIILILISQFISISPSPFLSPALHLCVLLLEKYNYNSFIKNMLHSSLLQWQVFQSRLIASTFKDTLRIFEIITNSKTSTSNYNETLNEYLDTIISSDETVKLAYEISCLTDFWMEKENHVLFWLSSLCKESLLLKHFDLIIISLVLHSNLEVSIAAIDWSLILCIDAPKICFQTLSVVLYRLAKETSPLFQKTLLRKLPDLSLDKRNVTLILHTFESLKTVPSLGPFILILYVKLWIKDDRSAPYLEKTLNILPYNFEMQVARARATRLIAEERPGQMSSNLAKIISETLNNCTSEQGELASAEALFGIAALCQAKIIDIISTWKTLAPRFDHENRPRVIVSLCNFFSVIPSVRVNNSKFYDLMCTATQLLFNYFFHQNPLIVKSSLKALASYNMDEILIQSLPSKLLSKEDEIKVPETMLSFVSGDFWIHMIEFCHPEAKKEFTDLISLWLNKQNKSTTSFQKEPSQLNYLPNYNIFKALANSLFLFSQKSILNNEEIKKIDLILMILNRNFNMPLPQVNWLPCLNDLLALDKKFHSNILGFCSRQAINSPSARQCAANYISNFQWLPENITMIETLFDLLKYLGRSIQPDTLEIFVKKSLDNALSQCHKETLGSMDHLKLLFHYLYEALTCSEVHEVNKRHFSGVIKDFSNNLDSKSQEFLYCLECLKLLPKKPLECILFWHNSVEKSILLSCETVKYLYVEEKTGTPLVWLNNLIEYIAPLPEYHTMSLIEITKLLNHCIQNKNATTKWLLELLGQTQCLLIHKSPQHKIEYFCDIFIILILLLSGHNALVKSDIDNIIIIGKSKNIRLDLFPFAIADLLTNNIWKHLSIQVFEWLYHMTKNNYIDELYINCFTKALYLLKKIDHFHNSNVWLTTIR